MISEERVKELYHLAAFDEYENKKYHQAGEYTMWDYVGKEIVKSFFSGTIAFILLIVFWGLGDIDTITKWINRVDLTTFVPKLIVAYAGFMIVYLLITARSRHCDKGVRIRVLCTSHWSFCSGKEMTGGDLSVRKPACCWYGGANPRSRGIGCTKKP